MNRPNCPQCGKSMLPSEDGVSFYCPKCHEYISRDNEDEYAEQQFGA